MPRTPCPCEPPLIAGTDDGRRGGVLAGRRALVRGAAGASCAIAIAVAWGGTIAATQRVEVDAIATLPGVRLPPGPLVLAMARVTLPPGVASAATSLSGARLLATESGVVTLRLAERGRSPIAPGTSGRAASGAASAVRLREGRALALPALAVDGLANEGSAPAVVLDVAIFPGGARRPRSSVAADGAEVRMLAVALLDGGPGEPVDFALRRLRLPPGGAMPPQFGDGIALLWVERGRVEAEVAAGTAALAVVAGSVGSAGSARTGRTGSVWYLPAGSSAAVGSGSNVLARATAGGEASLVLATLRPTVGRSPGAQPNDDPGSRRGG